MTTMQSQSLNGHSNGNNVGIVGMSMNGLSNVSQNYVNPAQMSQAIHPVPSPANGSQKKKPPPNAKRRRTDPPDDPVTLQRKNRDGPRKKKANRACFHCQKAHLTCDDSRPCQRCIKRGLADNCTEGHRKKAKYLLDEDELEQLKRSKSYATESSSEPSIAPPTTESFSPSDPLFNVPFDPSFSFGSEAANLEYSILSAILGNPSPESQPEAPSPQIQYTSGVPNSTWTPDSLSQSQYNQSPMMGSNGYGTSYAEQQPMLIQPSDPLSASPASQMSPQFMDPYPAMPQYQHSPKEQSGNQQQMQYAQPYTPHHQQQPSQQPQQPIAMHPLEPRYPREFHPSPSSTSAPPVYGRSSSRDSMILGSPTASNSPASTPINTSYTDGTESRGSQLQRIHARVTRPFDYTEGYHILMKHLKSRFEKNDILRIVRALAIFRPSLIALQMPLTEEDEIFVEKCFQRSLLELEKLISFSGTPTVVWRRTGEICLVAPEFCMLTEWSMGELTGRRTYIFELFENQSVVEYYENFAEHAFENTTQSVYSHCVLLKPSGAPIPTTFCFSIRRDIYDLPSIVIGQWLPLL